MLLELLEKKTIEKKELENTIIDTENTRSRVNFIIYFYIII